MVDQRDFAMAVLKVDLMVILIVLKMVDALTVLMVISLVDCLVGLMVYDLDVPMVVRSAARQVSCIIGS
jgi:hypothetical protein